MEVLTHILNLVSRNQGKTCTAFDFNRWASVQLRELATEKVKTFELFMGVKNERNTAVPGGHLGLESYVMCGP